MDKRVGDGDLGISLSRGAPAILHELDTYPAQALPAAVHAATVGAAHTASMHPRRGRSSYVGDRALGYVDPGARAVALWLTAMRDALMV